MKEAMCTRQQVCRLLRARGRGRGEGSLMRGAVGAPLLASALPMQINSSEEASESLNAAARPAPPRTATPHHRRVRIYAANHALHSASSPWLSSCLGVITGRECTGKRQRWTKRTFDPAKYKPEIIKKRLGRAPDVSDWSTTCTAHLRESLVTRHAYGMRRAVLCVALNTALRRDSCDLERPAGAVWSGLERPGAS